MIIHREIHQDLALTNKATLHYNIYPQGALTNKATLHYNIYPQGALTYKVILHKEIHPPIFHIALALGESMYLIALVLIRPFPLY